MIQSVAYNSRSTLYLSKKSFIRRHRKHLQLLNINSVHVCFSYEQSTQCWLSKELHREVELTQIHAGWKTREVVEGVRGEVLFLQSSRTPKLAHKALWVLSASLIQGWETNTRKCKSIITNYLTIKHKNTNKMDEQSHKGLCLEWIVPLVAKQTFA